MALKNPQNISPMGNEATQFGLINPEQCSPYFVIASHATAYSLEKACLLQEYGRFKRNIAILKEKLAKALADSQEKTCFRNKIKELERNIAILNEKLANALADPQEKTCLLNRIEELLNRIEELEGNIANLNEKLAKPTADSQNSSKPGSSDLFKGKIKDKAQKNDDVSQKRSQGGQPGHKRHSRANFTMAEADAVNENTIEGGLCPICGTKMDRRPERDKQRDRYDLPLVKVQKIIELIHAFYCPKCKKYHYGSLSPDVVKAGLISASFGAILAMLNGGYSLSIGNTKKIIEDVYGAKLSEAYICSALNVATLALRASYLELLDNVKNHEVLYIDETSYRYKDKRSYVWIFCNESLSAFKIGTRSAYTLDEVLGDSFDGTIVSDYYAAYRSYGKKRPEVRNQFCLAHFARDAKYCADYNAPEPRAYGERLKRDVEELFAANRLRREAGEGDAEEYEALLKLQAIKERIIDHATNDVPESCPKARGIAKRFLSDPEAYFVFIMDPRVEPTSNEAERGLRPIVIRRKISYGTHSLAGNRYCETLWSVSETLNKTGQNRLSFITKALSAHYAGELPPSLVNIGQTVDPKYVKQAEEEQKKLDEDKKALAAKKAEAKKKLAELKAEAKEAKPKEPASGTGLTPEAQPEGAASRTGLTPEAQPEGAASRTGLTPEAQPKGAASRADSHPNARPKKPKPGTKASGPKSGQPPVARPKGLGNAAKPPPKAESKESREEPLNKVEPWRREAPEAPLNSAESVWMAADGPSSLNASRPINNSLESRSKPSDILARRYGLRAPGQRKLKAPETDEKKESGACPLNGPHSFLQSLQSGANLAKTVKVREDKRRVGAGI